MRAVTIDSEGEFRKWLRSDVTATHSKRRWLVLLLLSPAIVVWALMFAGFALAIAANAALYAGCAALIDGLRGTPEVERHKQSWRYAAQLSQEYAR